MDWSPPYSRERLSLPDEAIYSERLILRKLQVGDIEALWEMDSDPDVMEFMPMIYSDKTAHREEMLKEIGYGDKFKFFRFIALKETNEPVGWFLFRPTENQKWVEVGYRLLKKQWGNGYATEACRTFIQLGFEKWGVKEIMAILSKENKNSARVAEKLGLTYRGQTQDYHDMDLAFYLLEKT